MRALRHLEDEHRLIEPILGRAHLALSPFDAETVREVVDFFLSFVDRLHHTKEEQVLFDAVREHGGDMVVGPLGVVEKEHAVLRAHLRTTLESLDAAFRGEARAIEQVQASLGAYVELTRAHLRKEETILLPLAERILPLASDAFLMAQLLDLDRKTVSPGDLARWAELAGRTEVHPKAQSPRAQASEGRSSPLEARGLVSTAAIPAEPKRTQRDVVTAVTRTRNGMIFDDGVHKNVLLHDFGRGLSIQANQYLIIHGDEALILDPGGPKVYPDVFAEMTSHVSAKSLRHIFLSHQDPDIGTSLNAWLMDTEAEAWISRLWLRFLPHFGIDKLIEQRLHPIPDDGMVLHLGGAPLVMLPAHFLHSPGNFQIYDPTSKVLFSGDLGASVEGDTGVVSDFDAHARTMLGFHRRYMASERAMNAWVKMVRKLDIDTIAPQHGGMFRGSVMVNRFIDWCEGLRCGVDLLEEYQAPPIT